MRSEKGKESIRGSENKREVRKASLADDPGCNKLTHEAYCQEDHGRQEIHSEKREPYSGAEQPPGK